MDMIWVFIYIPLGIYLSVCIASRMNLFSLGLVALTVAVFFLVEFKMVSNDKKRSRHISWVMFLTLVSLAASIFFK